jgi:hypothetical protein
MPVGGAPSRSGFLATPTDASPKPTFSEGLSIKGEEMPGFRPTRENSRQICGHRRAAYLSRTLSEKERIDEA